MLAILNFLTAAREEKVVMVRWKQYFEGYNDKQHHTVLAKITGEIHDCPTTGRNGSSNSQTEIRENTRSRQQFQLK